MRSNLGIQMVGEGTLTYTTNAIFRCDGLEQLHTTRPAYRYIFIGPEGTWATLVAINGRDQWRFSLIGDHTRRQASEAEMIEAITRAVGRDFEFEVLSILPWQRRQLVAEHYGKGRVFLAGDSAHLTSPTGGFGMNTGILDAVNLSWKLAASIQGWGSQTLLDSYEAEQRPVAERNVGEASENLRRMLAPRVASPDPQLFDLSDISEATMSARRAFGDSYTEAMSREWHTIGIHLGYVYEDSPVILGDDTPAPKLAVSTYEQSARPGSRAPHAWLDETRTSSVIDLFGREFVLLRFDGSIDTLSFERAAEHLGVPLVTIDINDSEIAALYARKLVLVRPDGQVCWRGDSADQAASVVSRVTGHPTHPASSEVAPVLSGTA